MEIEELCRSESTNPSQSGCWNARLRSLVSFEKLDQCPRDASLEERAHLPNPKKKMHQVGDLFFRDPILLSLEGRNAYRITKF